MYMEASVQALIWDFGGVLFRTEDQEPRRRWEQRLNLQPGELHDLVFMGKASRLATVGQASTEDIWRSVGEKLALQHDDLAALRRDFWEGDRLDQGLIDATRALREHLKTALLSNAWPDMRPFLESELQIEDVFDLLVISAEEGTAKPGEEIYLRLLERLEVPAETCIFVDDDPKNVHAAETLGIHAIAFRERQQVITEIRALLPKALDPLLAI
jgi:epoxide hydrolase-like predicted phosphatase